jgi:8-oxo-dGTP pyrophosphatase MutT (NUDIX family)
MKYKTKYGFPVVNAKNVFAVLKDLGVEHWKSLSKPIPLDKYIKKTLTVTQKKEIDKFAPKLEVEVFENPKKQKFTGFRATWPYGMGVHIFTILPGDLIPVTAEFRHGAEIISIILPGGITDPDKSNLKSRMAHAKKEFEEETGILLEKVVPIETKDTSGIALSARQVKQKTCGFLGIVPKKLSFQETNLDHGEFLKAVLIPVNDLIKLIMEGSIKEASIIMTTFMALHKMNRLKLL